MQLEFITADLLKCDRGIDSGWSQRTKQNLRLMVSEMTDSGAPQPDTVQHLIVCLGRSILEVHAKYLSFLCWRLYLSLLSITHIKPRVKTWEHPSWSVTSRFAESPPSVELSFSDFIALTSSEPQVIICDKPNCVLISGSLCGCVHEAESLCKGNWKAERESHICSPWETEVKLWGSFLRRPAHRDKRMLVSVRALTRPPAYSHARRAHAY